MFRKKNKKIEETFPIIDLSRASARALNNPLHQKPTAEEQDPSSLEVLKAIENAFFVIDDIRDIIVEASHLVLKAVATDETSMRALLAERYDELRDMIGFKIEQADASALRLIGPDAKVMNAKLSGIADYTVRPACLDVSEKGLDLPPPIEAFAEAYEMSQVMAKLEQALAKVAKTSADYMHDTKFLISRLEMVS